MADLVDHEAVVVDLRSRLLSRPSWGQPQLLALLAELEAEHRIDESADRRALRRLGVRVTEVVLDLTRSSIPSPTTGAPLADGARSATPPVMGGGEAPDHHQQTETPCRNSRRSTPPTTTIS